MNDFFFNFDSTLFRTGLNLFVIGLDFQKNSRVALPYFSLYWRYIYHHVILYTQGCVLWMFHVGLFGFRVSSKTWKIGKQQECCVRKFFNMEFGNKKLDKTNRMFTYFVGILDNLICENLAVKYTTKQSEAINRFTQNLRVCRFSLNWPTGPIQS